MNADNQNYSSKDGVLFNKNKTILIRYPQGNLRTSYVIPNTVTSIEDYAFEECTALKTITVPKSVKKIDEFSFGFYTAQSTLGYCYTKIPNFKIKCYVGTAGEQYAIENEFDYELLDAPAHTHSYTSKVTKKATCTEAGTKTYTCSCGDTYTETIKATGHSYTAKIVKPTYLAQGYTLHTCSLCGKSYKDTPTAKLTLANITKVSFTSAQTAVKMSWGKVSGATGYRVYKYNASTKKWVGVANTTSTAYTFKNLKAGTNYKFTVRAYKTVSGKTVLSPKYSTFTTSTNPATVKFTLTAGSKKATVKWNKVTGATGYKIYYKTSSTGKWVGLKTTDNAITSYTKTGLTTGKRYYFTVKAYRTVGGKTYNGKYATKSVVVK